MRRLAAVGLASLVLAAFGGAGRLRAAGAADPVRALAAARGKNRVLLVFASSGRDPDYVAQRRLWEPETAGFADRDMLTVPILAASRRSSPLAGRFHVTPGRFAVILIGKDGNEAYRSERPFPAGDLYARIDAMPMRREEMRRKAGSR